MNFQPLRRLIFSAALVLALAAPGANVLPSADVKKLANRYPQTKARIQELLGARQHPAPVPATALPNPFSRSGASGNTGVVRTPEAFPETDMPALPDTDALARYAASLKVGGYLVRDGVPHATINGAICKAGDTITVGPRERPVFLYIVSLNAQEITLRLNEVTYTLPMSK